MFVWGWFRECSPNVKETFMTSSNALNVFKGKAMGDVGENITTKCELYISTKNEKRAALKTFLEDKHSQNLLETDNC